MTYAIFLVVVSRSCYCSNTCLDFFSLLAALVTSRSHVCTCCEISVERSHVCTFSLYFLSFSLSLYRLVIVHSSSSFFSAPFLVFICSVISFFFFLSVRENLHRLFRNYLLFIHFLCFLNFWG